MRALHLILMAALLALPALSSAQQRAIEHDMTPEEFKAAGLDRLAPEELARLNAWLGRRVAEETTTAVAQAAEQAREEGRQQVVRENRGFFHFGSDAPIESAISGEFNGFAKGRRYRLENGQVWEQTDSASLAGVRRAAPAVRIRPGVMGTWWLKIDGYNTQAKVQRIE